MASHPLRHVVLIDDSEADLLYTGLMLERSGVVGAVHPFESARAALDWLEATGGAAVDLVLLDINMPGMDGFGFLEAYQGRPVAASAPAVVMLTSSPDPDDQRRATAYPCVRGYVTKPLTLQAVHGLPQLAQS